LHVWEESLAQRALSTMVRMSASFSMNTTFHSAVDELVITIVECR